MYDVFHVKEGESALYHITMFHVSVSHGDFYLRLASACFTTIYVFHVSEGGKVLCTYNVSVSHGIYDFYLRLFTKEPYNSFDLDNCQTQSFVVQKQSTMQVWVYEPEGQR